MFSNGRIKAQATDRRATAAVNAASRVTAAIMYDTLDACEPRIVVRGSQVACGRELARELKPFLRSEVFRNKDWVVKELALTEGQTVLTNGIARYEAEQIAEAKDSAEQQAAVDAAHAQLAATPFEILVEQWRAAEKARKPERNKLRRAIAEICREKGLKRPLL